MTITVLPSKLHGTISAPASKSVSHRAIILASLAQGTSVISNILVSDDTTYTIEAMRAFGVQIDVIPTAVEGSTSRDLKIHGCAGKLIAPKEPINLGFSGSSMRLLTGVAALAHGVTILTGEKRLLERPNTHLLLALNKLGIRTNNPDIPNTPTIVEGGTLLGGTIEVPGNISSQFISAMLLIAPFAKSELTITTKDLRSKPYIDITIDVMKTFGVQATHNNYESFTISPQQYTATDYTVEGDYSSASYFFAANAITGSDVSITGLRPDSKQADRAVIDIISKLQPLTANKLITIDMGQCPDIVQTVAIVAAFRAGITTITNIGHLRFKETDRIAKTALELNKMGIETDISENSLSVRGGHPRTSVVSTYNDHRMAMSFAIAGLATPGGVTIANAEVGSKSYPNFWNDLESIGCKLSYE